MPSKYREIAKKFPKLPAEDLKRQDLLVGIKLLIFDEEEFKIPELTELKWGILDQESLSDITSFVRSYRALRLHRDMLDKIDKLVGLHIEALEQILSERYEAAGIDSVKLVEGGSLGVTPDPVSKVTKPEEFREWCKEEELMGSFKLPWQTMNSLVKERLLAGEPEPPGVSVFMKDKFTLRKK